MPGFESLAESFVVTRESSKSSEPGEGSFDDPSSGEEDESSLRLGMLDDFQAYPLFLGVLSGVLARTALVDEGDLHALLADFLDLASQCRDLRSLALIGGIVFGAVAALFRGARGFAIGFTVGAILVPTAIIGLAIMFVRSGVFASPG